MAEHMVASPGLPSVFLAKMAKVAGVNIFSTRGDQLFHGGSWLGIHSKRDGILSVPLAGNFDVEDAMTRKEVAFGARTISLNMKRGETVLLWLRKSSKTSGGS